MRRALSISLILLFWLGPLAATLQASRESSLPTCCRRHGAHHCAMTDEAAASWSQAATASGTAFAAPAHCPCFPGYVATNSAAGHALAASAVSLPVLLASERSSAASLAAARISQVRTRVGRGPPSPILRPRRRPTEPATHPRPSRHHRRPARRQPRGASRAGPTPTPSRRRARAWPPTWRASSTSASTHDKKSLELEEQPRTRLHLSSCEARSAHLLDGCRTRRRRSRTGSAEARPGGDEGRARARRAAPAAHPARHVPADPRDRGHPGHLRRAPRALRSR